MGQPAGAGSGGAPAPARDLLRPRRRRRREEGGRVPRRRAGERGFSPLRGRGGSRHRHRRGCPLGPHCHGRGRRSRSSSSCTRPGGRTSRATSRACRCAGRSSEATRPASPGSSPSSSRRRTSSTRRHSSHSAARERVATTRAIAVPSVPCPNAPATCPAARASRCPGRASGFSEKAPSVPADMTFLDLEDSVAAAREGVGEGEGRRRDPQARLGRPCPLRAPERLGHALDLRRRHRGRRPGPASGSTRSCCPRSSPPPRSSRSICCSPRWS